MLRRRDEEIFDAVLSAAAGMQLAGFTARPRRAVQAGLNLPSTAARVEGRVGHIKMTKRTMSGRSGRACLGLLRARVPHGA